MYQTVGHNALDFYSEAMGLKLYRRKIAADLVTISKGRFVWNVVKSLGYFFGLVCDTLPQISENTRNFNRAQKFEDSN